MPRRGGRRKKRRTHVDDEQTRKAVEKLPRSMVFKRGKVEKPVVELVENLKQMMAPYTALKLRTKKANTIKDFVRVAGPLGVTHFLILSQSDEHVNLRLGRVPRGPTLSFQVDSYMLMKHVHAMQRRPMDTTMSYISPPLVVLNNFADCDKHMKIVSVTFQNMFPAINVATIKLSNCRRIVLLHRHKESGLLELRQYGIRAVPVGLSRSVKRVVRTKIPDLSNLTDISEYVLRPGAAAGASASDSEADDETNQVTLPQKVGGRGNVAKAKSAIRLQELGPRLTLRLTKIQEQLCSGEVLFHAFVNKTPEEVAAGRKEFERKVQLKAKRRATQEANVQRKAEEKEAKRSAKAERKRARELKAAEVAASAAATAAAAAAAAEADSDDSDSDSDDSDDSDSDDSDDSDSGDDGKAGASASSAALSAAQQQQYIDDSDDSSSSGDDDDGNQEVFGADNVEQGDSDESDDDDVGAGGGAGGGAGAVTAAGGYEDSSSDDGAGAGFASFAKDSDSELDEGDSDYGDALDDIDDTAAMTAKPASASRKRAPLAPLASSKRTQRPAAAAAQRGSMSRAAARKKKRQRTRR